MYSMTGYGKGVSVTDGGTVTVEIKTVNHRYLDYGIKLPKNFLFLEDGIKKLIGASISRGHVDMYLTYEQKTVDKNEISIDREFANAYVKEAKALAKELGCKQVADAMILKLPEFAVSRKQVLPDDDVLRTMTMEALREALDGLKTMRQNEGRALMTDIGAKLDNIAASLEEIKKLAPTVSQNYRKALNARIAEVLEPGKADEQRLATEVALYADHCCIDEEITRLSTHIETMRKLIEQDEPIGRKTEFLVQEFNREANTIGSKANDLDITNHVLAIKNEIEKIREQAANVE